MYTLEIFDWNNHPHEWKNACDIVFEDIKDLDKVLFKSVTEHPDITFRVLKDDRVLDWIKGIERYEFFKDFYVRPNKTREKLEKFRGI